MLVSKLCMVISTWSVQPQKEQSRNALYKVWLCCLLWTCRGRRTLNMRTVDVNCHAWAIFSVSNAARLLINKFCFIGWCFPANVGATSLTFALTIDCSDADC